MQITFWLRMLGCFGYSMMVQYYYGYGDSFTYFSGGNFFRDQVSADISNISYIFAPFEEMESWYDSLNYDAYFTGYFATPANNMVMRISWLFSYFSFNTFLITSLFFAFFSFLGQWKLFLVFDKLNAGRHRKLMAFAVLYSPSIWFWGSGLLKDSICLGAAGFIIHILYKILVDKKISIRNLIWLAFLVFVVSIIKSYITVILAIGLCAMLFSVFLKSIKNKIARTALLIVGLGASGVFLYASDFITQINEMAEESIQQIQEFQKNYQIVQESEETSKAGFGLGELEPTLGSLLFKSPAVIFTTLFRPFIWESGKIIILFTSLESLCALLCTLYIMFRMGLIRFFRTIFTTPHMLFCFIITMLFALVIGFTTFNFGTMIRYKIIFLPFYYFLLANLYSAYIAGRNRTPNQAPVAYNAINQVA